MLPAVLEVFVLWHPDDVQGAQVADQLVDHFHGTVFTGLIGGAVEVYVRSQGWHDREGAPRPLPLPDTPEVNGVDLPRCVGVVPVLGRGFALQVQRRRGPWWQYVQRIGNAGTEWPDRVRVFPLPVWGQLDGTALAEVFGGVQWIGTTDGSGLAPTRRWRRELVQGLVQGLAQMVTGPGTRLQVFISHTRKAPGDGSGTAALTELVRDTIATTRLTDFFDAHDLQPGEAWRTALRQSAGHNALLALRTDLYSGRAWCQEEVLTAKRSGVPVVILDALEAGESRGSFLMDHVPRVPVRRTGADWSREDVEIGLDLIVDETLKRGLWRILHPDPPLGEPERQALEQLVRLSGHTGRLDVMTPTAAGHSWRMTVT